ncbi:MAG TPA: mechanosensitive ion channel domain-containing protein [Polyangiaceae bacterium]|nr:mechanosensitive ion channel domain-containing protein [Polyangiaceae bacterium]
MPPNIKALLERKLVTLGGSPITVESLLVGLAILTITILVANALAFMVRRLLGKRGSPTGAQVAIAKMVRYAVLAVGAAGGLESMGVHLNTLLAASAVLAVGIGFGLQNIAQNFISGIILLIEQPVRHGDFVKVGGILGTVEDIGLRATHIITRDEVTIIVPNSSLVSAEVINHSRPTTKLRVRIPVGVAYGSDVERTKQLLLDMARANPDVLEKPPPDVRLEDFGDSALAFVLYAWIGNARDDLSVGSALRFAIEKAFRENGIEIPFPQHDVHMRTK